MSTLTTKQISALKYLISRYRDKRKFMEYSKKIAFFLIDKSNKLTKEVCFTLVEGQNGFNAKEIRQLSYGIESFVSSNCDLHISEILTAMGTDFRFCIHYGDYNPRRKKKFNTDGQFPGGPLNMVADKNLVKTDMPMRYTFWLAKGYYTRKAHMVKVDRTILDEIDITKDGLYNK